MSDDKDQLFVCATDEKLETLERNIVWHAGGTFKVFFFTIHAVVNNQFVPLVFFLIQNKSEEHYF